MRLPHDGIANILDTGGQSRAELREYGHSLRERFPFRGHGAWRPDGRRPDAIALLRAQDEIRIAELVPIRYGRMADSPFRFFRGAAAIMAWDLGNTPTAGVHVQACGDAHVQNFGMYASPERRVVFDINDFDETLPAPWEFDVKRLAASIVLECREVGFDDEHARHAARVAINQYRDVMRDLAKGTSLDIHYAMVDEHSFFDEDHSNKIAKTTRKDINKARRRTRFDAFRKWCTDAGGSMRFVDDPPLLVRLTAEETERCHQIFNSYRSTLQKDRAHVLREYRFRDAARRVSGVGSVGLGAYVMLLEGRGKNDPLIIQLKEATSSVLTPYIGKSGYERHGQRIVEGQRLMQATTDPFLGWARSGGRDYYLRQLRDMKGKGGASTDPEMHLADIEVTGGTLARAHARSLDPGLLAGYLGSSDEFPDNLTSFAFAYADQAEHDHARLLQAIKSGEVPAEQGI